MFLGFCAEQLLHYIGHATTLHQSFSVLGMLGQRGKFLRAILEDSNRTNYYMSYSQHYPDNYGHEFLCREYIKDDTKLEEGLLCPPLMVTWEGKY